MKSLEQIIEMSINMKASELVLTPSYQPRFKVAQNWVNADEEKCSASDLRKNLLVLLDEEQKKTVESLGVVQGQVQFREHNIRWQLFSSKSGLSAHFQWARPENEAPWGFPSAVYEVVAKTSGLSIIAGPKRSGKTSAVRSILSELSRQRLHISIFSDDFNYWSEAQDQALFENYPFERLQQLENSHFSADIIVIDSIRAEALSQAMIWAERGYSVILTMACPSSQAALELCSMNADQAKKLSQVFQLCLGVRLVSGIELSRQPVFELIMGTSPLRAHLREGRWEMIESLVQTTGEKTGMRSFNQSLMQLLLKRKIELKVGFASSPKPEELDHLLRKVGF